MADNNGKPLHEIMAELLANNGSQDIDKNKNVVGKTNTKVQIEKTDENVVDKEIDTDTIIKSAPFVKDPNGTQDEQVDGLAKGILVVSDPEITSEEFEEVADELQGIVDKTDAGEVPYTDKYKGDYILSCPICGGTFVSDKLLENGEDTCPICCKVPDSFVVNGKIEGEESVENKDDTQEEIEHKENLKEVPEDLEEREPEDIEDQEESPLRKEGKEMNGNKLQEEKEIKTEYYSMPDNEHIIWDSESSLDDYDLDDLKDNQYQDYLDEFDGTVTPMSYEEWLDSDECANLFDLEWEAAAKESDKYAEWYNFITDYVSEEEKKEAYNDYVESCKITTLQPDSFEEWLDNNISYLSEDIWEVKKEDLESNILPEIDNQLNSDILLLTGSYGSNYPDFRSSGNGGKLFKGIDEFRNYMGNWDRVCITTQEGVLGAILNDHDGTVSGQFYTIPTGKDKIEMLRKMGYEERLSEEYEEEEIDKYGAEGLMEDIFDNDMYYDGLDARDFSDVADMLVPVKDTISGYTPKEESKKVKTEARGSRNEISTSLSVDRENPLWIKGTCRYLNKEYRVNAKVFLVGSEYGINEGPISKLWIQSQDDKEVIVNYDRGWDVEPKDSTMQQMMDLVIASVEHFRKEHPYEVEDDELEESRKIEEYIEKGFSGDPFDKHDFEDLVDLEEYIVDNGYELLNDEHIEPTATTVEVFDPAGNDEEVYVYDIEENENGIKIVMNSKDSFNMNESKKVDEEKLTESAEHVVWSTIPEEVTDINDLDFREWLDVNDYATDDEIYQSASAEHMGEDPTAEDLKYAEEEVLEGYLEQYNEMLSEQMLEDWELNIEPLIEEQLCPEDLLILLGTAQTWNRTGDAGRVVRSMKELRELMSNYDIEMTIDADSNLSMEMIHHDGTHKMRLYTFNEDYEGLFNKLKELDPEEFGDYEDYEDASDMYYDEDYVDYAVDNGYQAELREFLIPIKWNM